MILHLLEALRPQQWTKNLLVFAGILFSVQMGSMPLVLRACAGFLSFSLLAGAVYLVNDLSDIEADRLHPRKRLRPIASGRLPAGVARMGLIPVLLVAGALAAWLGSRFAIVAGVYLLLNLAYTYRLKHQVLIDVFVVAGGFVLRAIAGVELLKPISPSTALSPWLLVCTFFGALFLALGKRRREIVNAEGRAGEWRQVLDLYSVELLDGLLVVSAAASLMGYALYTIWPTTVAKFGTEALLYTIPFVAYGIFRYLFLVQTSETTEDPSQVLLVDRPLGLCVASYLLTILLVLYRG